MNSVAVGTRPGSLAHRSAAFPSAIVSPERRARDLALALLVGEDLLKTEDDILQSVYGNANTCGVLHIPAGHSIGM